MQVNSINPVNYTNFKGHDERKTGGAAKAWCSFFIPGLGQFLDGRSAAGAGFLGGALGLHILASALYKNTFKPVIKQIEYMDEFSAAKNIEESFSILSKSKNFIGFGIIAFAALGLKIISIVDAYKGGKTNTKQQHYKSDLKEMNERLEKLEEQQALNELEI